MAFSANQLLQRLEALADDAAPPRLLVAFSGGMDSTVLLHALSGCWSRSPLCALHVDHGLQPDSGQWAERARRAAQEFGVDCIVRRAVVAGADGGPEAAARRARYRVFEDEIEPGDWLLTGQHRDDQAETFLLNALRGSGARGLAAMPAKRICGSGVLLRPLLDFSRAELASYARRHGLCWIDDPTNDDPSLDRNFLRHRVLPQFAERWPHAAEKFARSARLARGDSALLDDLAARDLGGVERVDRIGRATLDGLPERRRRNLLRYALRQLGLPPPPATALRRVADELLRAADDAEPVVGWRGAEIRRYREYVYLMAPMQSDLEPPDRLLTADAPVELGGGLGRLSLELGERGIDPDLVSRGLSVRFREGGERLRLDRGSGSRRLKTLLQDAAIVPWMRSRIPLLVQDDRLIAVADLWTSADALVPGGYVVEWEFRPPLS